MLCRAILPLLLLFATERSSPQQLGRVEERDIMQIILGRQDLSEFAEILQMEGLHRAYLDRQVTLFAPTNDALRAFGGRIVQRQFPRNQIGIVMGGIHLSCLLGCLTYV